MESNRKYVILGGLILVLTFGLFGMYVHFTKQDVLIGGSNNGDIIKKQSNSKTKNAIIDNSSTNAKNKNNTNDTVNAGVSENEANDNEAAELDIANSEETFIEYTVVKGDTLSGIWKKNIVSYTFNRAKDIIISKNNLSSADNLKVGQKLEIPSRDIKGYKKYTVKKSDNLSDIAKLCLPNKKVNEAVDLIIKANGKKNVDNLEPEQVLLIPKV